MIQPISISVVVLSHNEAGNLPRCLRALRDCAEVVVVDDGSTDDSQRIAMDCGARVVEHPFVSFADQRNWAMESAGLQHEWVLHLDADEVATPAMLQEICSQIADWPVDAVGWIARKVMLNDQWLRFSADYPVAVPRLVHMLGPRYIMRGHGDVLDRESLDSVVLKEPMLHYNFSKGWADWRARHLLYAASEAHRIRAGLTPFSFRSLLSSSRAARRSALRALSYRLPGRPTLRFLYAYVFRMGFLDGKAGLRFCLAMSSYERMIDEVLRKAKESDDS